MLLVSTSVFAYVTQVPTLVTVTPSSETMRCGHPTVVEATVLDQAGKPIKHLAVTWAFTSSPSSGDQIKIVSKQTNGRGCRASVGHAGMRFRRSSDHCDRGWGERLSGRSRRA